MTGTVYKSTGSWYTVKGADAQFYNCRIKGKFRLKGIKSTNPVAVGDQVDFDIEEQDGVKTGVITTIAERENYIVRKSVNLSKQTHIIASNIDVVFLIITLNNPPTHTAFIDRFLVTAKAYRIKTVLLFNKIETYNEEELDEIRYLAHLYRSIGYECEGISAKTGKNIDKVVERMQGKVCMFSGHSGVGKSTIVNAIEPSLDLKTKEISDQHKQGQHTTTFAEMYDLENDMRIIDTPGIKGFGMVDMEPEEVSGYFPEFFELQSNCKFNNCIHKEEPHCAIKAALEEGTIAWSRYRSYLQILEGDDTHFRKNNYTNEE